MKRVFFAVLVVIVLCVLGAGAVMGYAYRQQNAPGPLAEAKTVLIAPGTGFKAVAAQLAHEGVIANRELFMLPAVLAKQHRAVKAGEYAFTPHMSGAEVLAKLVKGDVVVHSLTVPEGLTVRQALQIIAADDALTGEVPQEVAEGTLLPETYRFIRGDSRASIVQTMRGAMTAALDKAWEDRADGLPVATKEEALVLASIVERETGVPEERGMVAGVYVNRLKLGMMLQADPTVAYGVMQAEGLEKERPITRSDLQADTAYNTYTRTGLPPTPIACPGKASILAVLHPADTDALYFVATGNGGHRFATTIEEHNRNVSQYRAALRNANKGL